MFTAESAIDLRSEAYDERIRDAVYTSKSDRSATIGIWYSKFDSDKEYKEAVNGMLTALSERGFSNIESYETDSTTHHHRTIISFTWASQPTKANTVVTGLGPIFRVTDRNHRLINVVTLDSLLVVDPKLRGTLDGLKVGEVYHSCGLFYTRTS